MFSLVEFVFCKSKIINGEQLSVTMKLVAHVSASLEMSSVVLSCGRLHNLLFVAWIQCHV